MTYALILERCLDQPLNITQSKLELLTSTVFAQLLAVSKDIKIEFALNSETGVKTPVEENLDRTESTSRPAPMDFQAPLNTATIYVEGSLVNRNGAGSSGITSYEGIRTQIESIIQRNSNSDYTPIKNILFRIGSGGGESAGNFPLTDFIKSLPVKYGIHTYGFTDSTACSAAYAVLAACEKTFAVDTAQVGSIGTVMSLVDVTKADEKQGIKYTILRSKSEKAAYNPHEEISKSVLTDAKTRLKVWDDKFNNLMHSYRPQLSLAAIDELKGKSVAAEEGVTLGLVDTIVNSIDDVFAAIRADTVVTPEKAKEVKLKSPLTKTVGNTMTFEEALQQNMQLNAELQALKDSRTLDISSAVVQERQRVTSIMTAKTTFGVSDSTTLNAITKGWPLDMVSSMFQEVAASKAADTAIVTGGGAAAPGQQVQAQQAAASLDNSANKGLNFLQTMTNSGQTYGVEKDLAGGAFSMADMLQQMNQIGAETIKTTGGV